MKKSERIHDLMIYLNGRHTFHLKDIMDRYHISKSTALRDIQSLESIGMPIYSQQGRNGFYGILANRLLSPIVFTVDEMYALYFAMLALNDYQTTPFHLSTTALKKKFEMCLSEEKIHQLRKMERILQMGGIKHFNESNCLKDILMLSIENKVCEVEYVKDTTSKIYDIQFFNISSAFGQWYATGFNFQTDKVTVFRCDKISSIVTSNRYMGKDLLTPSSPIFKSFKRIDAIDFRVEITKKGVDTFYKEHYPSMKLETYDGRFFINGYYHPEEETFIANYLIAYGKQILSVFPDELKNYIVKTIEALDAYYHQMNQSLL